MEKIIIIVLLFFKIVSYSQVTIDFRLNTEDIPIDIDMSRLIPIECVYSAYSSEKNPVNYDTVEFQSIQPEVLNQLTLTLKINADADVWIDWGEDAAVKITADGTDQAITSDYSTGSTTYNIKIYGQVWEVTKFSVNDEATLASCTSDELSKFNLTWLHLYNSGTTNYQNSEDYADNVFTHFYIFYTDETPGDTLNSDHMADWNLDLFACVKAGTGHAINTADLINQPITSFSLSYAGSGNTINSEHIATWPITYLFLNYIMGSNVSIDDADLTEKLLTTFRLYRVGNEDTEPELVDIHVNSANWENWPLVYYYLYDLGQTADVYVNSEDLADKVTLWYVDHVNSGSTSEYNTTDLTGLASGTWFYLDEIGTCTGQLADFPAVITFISIVNLGNDVDITSGTFKAWATTNFVLTPETGQGYTTEQIDAFLNKYAAVAEDGTGTQVIDLRGANAARSSASDDAVSTLTGLGKTIYTNP